MQMQSLSVHSTIGILRTHKSIDAFANADANAQWERNLKLFLIQKIPQVRVEPQTSGIRPVLTTTLIDHVRLSVNFDATS